MSNEKNQQSQQNQNQQQKQGQQQKQQSRVHVALVHAHGQYKNADYQQRGQEGIFFPVPGAAKA